MIPLGELVLIHLPEQVLMKHHVVEVVDHLIEVVELLQILPLGFQLLPKRLVFVLLVLNVSALLIQGVTILWKVNHVFSHHTHYLFTFFLQTLQALLLLLVHYYFVVIFFEGKGNWIVLVYFRLRKYFLVDGGMQVAFFEGLVQLGSESDFLGLETRVKVLESFIDHGGHGNYFRFQKHILVQKLHVKLAILKLCLLLLILNEL